MRLNALPIRPIDLTKDVMPLSTFRSTLAECFARTRRTHRPILVTQNGRSASVVIDVADFQRMCDALDRRDDARDAEAAVGCGAPPTPKESRTARRVERKATQRSLRTHG